MIWLRNQIAYVLVRLAAVFVVNGTVSITHDTTPGRVRHFAAERREETRQAEDPQRESSEG